MVTTSDHASLDVERWKLNVERSVFNPRWNEDFAEMLKHNLWRPRRFMTVYGIHLGGYIGGLVAMITAVILIRRKRRAP